MPRDIAYLVKRNGVYAAKYQKANGSWTHHSLHTERKGEAKTLFDQFRQDILQRKELELNRVVPVQLGELVKQHLADVERNQAESWLVKQRNYLNNYVLPFMGAKRMSCDITPRLIEEYVESRRKAGLKATTANKELSCIKALFRFGERRRYVLTSPARAVRLLRDDSDVHSRFLTYDECLRLVTLAGEPRPEHGVRTHQFNNWAEWLMLACHTGLRPGEQATLEFSDIDLTHGFLTVRRKPHLRFHPKNYQLRRVPLAEPAVMAIEKMARVKHDASDLLFHRADGSRWGDIAASFDSLVDRAGLQRKAPDNLTMHSLRHTFASWCSLGGLSLRRLQAILGHKSITTTERYSHLGNAGVHPAYARLAKFLNEFLPTGLPKELSEAEKRERKELEVIENLWWRRGDSNARPRDYETLALAS